MHPLRRQRTLAKPVSVDGFGLWSGADIHLEFRPAEANTGVVFVRKDISPSARIPALVHFQIETPRRTTLRNGPAHVEMVEHVLAALAGLKIDNCEIWVNQPEMPGMDGSSLAFVGALDSAGVVDQNALRAQIVVREITRLGDEEVWIEARPVNGPVATLKFRLEFAGCPAIGRQTVQFPHSSDAFRRELAPARTFLRQEEAEWLQARGIATRATYDNVLVFDADGPIQNKLRFRDECARHKTLDLIGDLSLSGCDLVGHFIAHRSGHRLNADLVRALLHEEQIEYSDDVRRSA